MKSSALAVITKRRGDAAAIFQQRDNRVLHEDVEAEMDSMVLKRADHLKAGTVAHVRQTRIAMSAEIALKDTAVAGAIEERAPGFKFANTCRRFPGVQFSHPPIVQVLSAAHGVGKVDAPVVAIIDVSHRGRDSAFRHDGMCFAEK